MNLRQARECVEKKIADLQPKLAAVIGEDFEIFNGGSIQTGLYYGPKPARHSISPDCPYPYIVEADLRIVLSKTHPHNQDMLRKIQAVIGGHQFESLLHRHWDRTDFPISRAYWYQDLNEGTGFEWELTVFCQPYNDVALYWEALFSPEEVDWQRNLRQLVTSAGIPHDTYRAMKKPQTFEARWRLVASHALSKLAEEGRLEGSPDMPVKGIAKPPVAFLVDKWIEGASGYRTMERPEIFISDEVLQILRRSYQGDVLAKALAMPKQPGWVAFADAVQRELKSSYRPNENLDISSSHDFTNG